MGLLAPLDAVAKELDGLWEKMRAQDRSGFDETMKRVQDIALSVADVSPIREAVKQAMWPVVAIGLDTIENHAQRSARQELDDLSEEAAVEQCIADERREYEAAQKEIRALQARQAAEARRLDAEYAEQIRRGDFTPSTNNTGDDDLFSDSTGAST